MESISIKNYLKKFIDFGIENNVEINDNMKKLALYKYFQFPAIKDSYSDVELYNNNGRFQLLFNKHDPTGFSFYIDEVRFDEYHNFSVFGFSSSMEYHREFMSDKKFDSILNMKTTLENSENFQDFFVNFSKIDVQDINDRFNKEEKLFLQFSKIYNLLYTKETINQNKSTVSQGLFELLNHYYLNVGSKQVTLAASFLDIIDNIEDSIAYSALRDIMKYENHDINTSVFQDRTIEDKLKFIKQLSTSEQFEDSLFSIGLNSKNPIIDIVDKHIFSKFKKTALLKLKIMLKEQTLDQIYKSNPILDDFSNKIKEEYPELSLPMNDRVKYETIFDKEFNKDLGEFLQKYNDGIKLCEDYESFLSINFETINLPPSYNVRKQSFFISKDNYNPYFMLLADNSAPLTISVDSLEVNSLMLATNLTPEIFSESLENVFLHCMKNKLVFVFHSRRFEDILGTHLEDFLKIKEKYAGIVPTVIPALDKCKYKLISESEMTFNQILEFDIFIDKKIKENVDSVEILAEGRKKVEQYNKLNIDQLKY